MQGDHRCERFADRDSLEDGFGGHRLFGACLNNAKTLGPDQLFIVDKGGTQTGHLVMLHTLAQLHFLCRVIAAAFYHQQAVFNRFYRLFELIHVILSEGSRVIGNDPIAAPSR